MAGWVDWLSELCRMTRFGVVGVVATVVYFVTTLLAIDVLAVTPIPASIVGHVAAASVSYFGHLRYSFRIESDDFASLPRFFVLLLLSFGLNCFAMWGTSVVIGAPPYVSAAVVSVLLALFGYLISRFWVFVPAPIGR